LLRGSTIGVPKRAASQFYDDVIRKSRVPARDHLKSAVVGGGQAGMDRDEDIDLDAVMKSIDVEVAKRASSNLSTLDSAQYDDAEEWEKVGQYNLFHS